MSIDRQQAYIETFRLAIREANRSGDELSLASLIASASGIKILVPVLRAELAPVSGELELHLRGESVKGHSANAEAFSELVRRIASATKTYVKVNVKASKQPSELLVDTGPGSVRVSFKAPAREEGHTELDFEGGGEIVPAEDEFSEALRRIAVVLANSDPDAPGSDALGAAIEQLPAQTRNELAKALEPVRKQEWEVSGIFTQRGLPANELSFGKRNAEYLSTQLRSEFTEIELWSSTGRLDGHRWSNGIAYFAPGDATRVIPASFANAEVQVKAAELAAAKDNRVEAHFRVHIKRSMSSETARRSYELVDIRAI